VREWQCAVGGKGLADLLIESARCLMARRTDFGQTSTSALKAPFAVSALSAVTACSCRFTGVSSTSLSTSGVSRSRVLSQSMTSNSGPPGPDYRPRSSKTRRSVLIGGGSVPGSSSGLDTCADLRFGHGLGNRSTRKVDGARELIEATGPQLLYLPPYSPDLNPIEKAWSKIKQILRATKARTTESLDRIISEALRFITANKAEA
jgi:hypothetical protein